jgi:ubiquitin C-terminal hydrolase
MPHCFIAVACRNCGRILTTFEHCQGLILDIDSATTLDDALTAYFNKECLTECHGYHCERCNGMLTRKLYLEKPPQVFCTQFNRYVILILDVTVTYNCVF